MQLVVDFNVVYSALVAKGVALKVFELNSKLRQFEFIAPRYMDEEFSEDKDKLLKQSSLSKEEFNKFVSLISSQIDFISEDEFIEMLPKANELNKKDAPYIALALKRNCGIFSGDEELKDLLGIKVFSPRKLLDILEST